MVGFLQLIVERRAGRTPDAGNFYRAICIGKNIFFHVIYILFSNGGEGHGYHHLAVATIRCMCQRAERDALFVEHLQCTCGAQFFSWGINQEVTSGGDGAFDLLQLLLGVALSVQHFKRAIRGISFEPFFNHRGIKLQPAGNGAIRNGKIDLGRTVIDDVAGSS